MTTLNNIADTQVKINDWIISVKHQPWSELVEVWLAREEAAKIFICYFTPTGEMELKEYTPGAVSPDPTMRINASIWEGIRRVINGVREEPDKLVVDAELSATKYHLEDLRKLVFKL